MTLLLWLWSCISSVEPPRDCIVVEDNRTVKLGRCLRRNGDWELIRLFLTWPQEAPDDPRIQSKQLHMYAQWERMYQERFPDENTAFLRQDEVKQPMLLIVHGNQRADRVIDVMRSVHSIGKRALFEVGSPPVVVEVERPLSCEETDEPECFPQYPMCYQPITHFYDGGHLDLMVYPSHFGDDFLEYRFRNFIHLEFSYRPFSVLNGSPTCQRDIRRHDADPKKTVFLPEIDASTGPYCGKTVVSVDNSAKWADVEPHLLNGTLLLIPVDWMYFPRSCRPPNAKSERQPEW